MLKRLYLSMLLLVACNSISAMEEVKQQITVPTRKKLEIIRPSQQRAAQEDVFSSTTVVTPIIPQDITQRVAAEVPRVVPVTTHGIRQNQPIREYIEIDTTLVDYHTGANVRYYSEYHAQPESGTHTVSFPLNCCDPLPIRNFGSIRYFFISAIEFGPHYYYPKSPLEGASSPVRIMDLDINKVIVVRAKNEFNRSEVYIGYNSNSGETKRGCRIYNGKILFIQIKEIPNSRMDAYNIHYRRIPVAGVGTFSNQEIGQEVRKYLQDPRDYNWQSPVFQKIVIELMGPREPGIVWDNQQFYSTICYWTIDENKLKGIHYRPH